jgi:hypothetical protein
MKFLSLTPMLQTPDVGGTIAWYAANLGFACVSRQGDDWCMLERDDVRIMFMRNAHLGAPSATATQYFKVDDATALFRSLEGRVKPEWGPERMPYDMLEFAVKDCNGYLLSFGQPLDEE